MVPLEVAEATASSHYASLSYGPNGLHPGRLIDGDKADGGWVTDIRQTEGAWLEFRLRAPAHIHEVEIVNGFMEGGGGYYRHLRPRDVRISFPGTDLAPVPLSLADDGKPQVFEFDSGVAVDCVRIDIASVWREGPDPSANPFEVIGLRHVEWRGHPA